MKFLKSIGPIRLPGKLFVIVMVCPYHAQLPRSLLAPAYKTQRAALYGAGKLSYSITGLGGIGSHTKQNNRMSSESVSPYFRVPSTCWDIT